MMLFRSALLLALVSVATCLLGDLTGKLGGVVGDLTGAVGGLTGEAKTVINQVKGALPDTGDVQKQVFGIVEEACSQETSLTSGQLSEIKEALPDLPAEVKLSVLGSVDACQIIKEIKGTAEGAVQTLTGTLEEVLARLTTIVAGLQDEAAKVNVFAILKDLCDQGQEVDASKQAQIEDIVNVKAEALGSADACAVVEGIKDALPDPKALAQTVVEAVEGKVDEAKAAVCAIVKEECDVDASKAIDGGLAKKINQALTGIDANAKVQAEAFIGLTACAIADPVC